MDKKYVIMSRNTLDGYLSGFFKSLDSLFLEKVEGEDDDMSVFWCPVISEARQFDSEEAAQAYMDEIWGSWFNSSSHAIVSYVPQSDDERNAKTIKTHQRTLLEEVKREYRLRRRVISSLHGN